MIAAKHLDIVMGVDIHIILIPTPGGPVPTPIPHPFVGMLFDPDEYDLMGMAMGALQSVGVDLTPALDLSNVVQEVMGDAKAMLPSEQLNNLIEDAKGAMKEQLGISPPQPGVATVYVNGLPRAHSGTKGYAMPPHIPMGGPFQKGKVPNACEGFMGSLTVSAQNRPFSFLGCLMLSCSCVGMKSLHNSGADLFLPTSTVLSIPMGRPVLVGGPPVPDLNALLNKLFDKLFDKALNALKNSKLMKKVSQKIHNAAKKAMDKLGIPKDSFVRDMVHDEICETTGHPVVIATGKVYTSSTDFSLPGPIALKWGRKWKSTSRYSGMYGNGWHGNYDLSLALYNPDNVVVVRMADGRPVIFPPIEIDEQYTNAHEKLTLIRKKDHYLLRDNNLYYRFAIQKSIIRQEIDVFPLTSVEDLRGASIRFFYNQEKFLEKIVDSAGRELAVKTDPKGRITAISAPHPEHRGETFNLVAYKYDLDGNLIERRDALDQAFTYAYAKRLLVQETNRNGLNFYFEYDNNERCIHTWGDGSIYDHRLVYNLEEKWTAVTDSLGNTTRYYWNDKGLNWKIVDPLGHVRYKRFTPTAKVQATIDELGQTTTHEYNESGKTTKTIYPDGTSLALDYKDDLLIGATDQNGGKWAWEYNEKRQQVKRTDCLGRVTTYQYVDGFLAAIHDPAGGLTQVEWDADKNLSRLVEPNGAVTSWRYDRLGRTLEAQDPRGNSRKWKYNYLGQALKIWERDGNIREFAYDGESNLVHAKDKHYDVRFEYAQMNRLKARTEAGTRVEFKYDTEGNLLGIINEHGYVYRFELDQRFRVIAESGFDGVMRKYNRDAAGRVVEVQRPGGNFTRFDLDAMDRVLAARYSDGTSETFAFRADGELMVAANDNIQVSFERDALGYATKEQLGSFVIESQYDALGLRRSMQSSLGAQLEFERNIMGDIEQVMAQAGGDAWEAGFKRDVAGLELERLLPGNVRAEWKRDRLGRPVEHRTETAGGRLDRSRKYTWDVNSRLQQIDDSKLGVTRFEHDVFGNLAAATYGDGSSEYRVPDAVGNLFRRPDRSDRKYGPAGQLLEAGGTTYEYDPEGNLVKKTQPDGGVWRYEWNAAGMLRAVVRPDGETVSFIYDALGRRIAKQFRNKLTRWVWDGNNILHEWTEPVDGKTPILAKSLTANPPTDTGIRILRKDNGHQPASKEPQVALVDNHGIHPDADITTWIFEPGRFAPLARLEKDKQFSVVTDYLGTPVGMYNAQGEKTWEMELSIYGQARNVDGWRESCPFRYPGQYEDEETGLYYNRFRYYDPQEGFYVSQDPIRLQGGLGIYAYVSDPNTWKDQFGLSGQNGDCGPDEEEEEAVKEGSAGGPTAGKKFTAKDKAAAKEENIKENGGFKCEDCGVDLVDAKKSEKGVTPPANEAQYDHIYPRSEGGNTTPENRQVLCRECNREKSDQLPTNYYSDD